MANDKELIKKLYSIALKQQKIITKLAQVALPPDTITPSAPGPVPPVAPAAGPAVQQIISGLIPSGVEVLYAKKQDGALVVGVKVSDVAKWETFKPSIEKRVASALGVSSVSWRE